MQTVQRIVKKTQNGSKMRHLVRKPGLKEALYVEYQTSKHADYTKHCTMMCHMCQFFFFFGVRQALLPGHPRSRFGPTDHARCKDGSEMGQPV